MVVHRRKKSRKKRGWQRRLGGKRRGAGNRGGRGRAGFGKRAGHRKFKALKEGLAPGKKGFTSVQQQKGRRPACINLDQINEIALEMKAAGKELVINVLDLGYEKVLGRGELTLPVEVRAKYFTKKAIEKIEKAGGKAVVI